MRAIFNHLFRRPTRLRCAVAFVAAFAMAPANAQDTMTVPEKVYGSPQQSSVQILTLSPDGGSFLTNEADFSIHHWDAHTGELRHTLTASGGPVVSAEFSPDGSRIVGGFGHSTFVWDAATGEELLSLQGYFGRAVYFPDGESIVTTDSAELEVTRLDAATGELIRSYPGDNTMIVWIGVSPDGQLVAAASTDGIVYGWNADTGDALWELTEHSDEVWSVDFHPVNPLLLTGSADGTARLWDTESGQSVHVLQGHTDSITTASFSPDGLSMLTASRDGTARVWDTATGGLLVTLSGHSGVVNSAQFTADAASILTASEDGTARLWDVASGAETLLISGVDESIRRALLTDEDAAVLLGTQQGSLARFDAASGARAWGRQGHIERVNDIAYTSDGAALLSGSYDSTARIWNTDSAQQSALFDLPRWIYSVAWSPDDSQVVVGLEQGEVMLLEADTGDIVHLLDLSVNAAMLSVAYSMDGARVLTGSADQTATLWDSDTGALLRKLEGHTLSVWSVAVSPDSNLLLTAGGAAHLWDAAADEPVWSLTEGESIRSVAFSPDGASFLTGGYDGEFRMWDTQTGNLLRTFIGNTGRIDAVAFSPDGARVFSGSEDGSARSWNAHTGDAIRIYLSPSGMIWSLSVAPDGERFATAGGDPLIYEWPVWRREDINRDDVIDAVDVQIVINAALGLPIDEEMNPDVTGDGETSALDIQRVINAALDVV